MINLSINKKDQLLWEREAPLEESKALAKKIASELKSVTGRPFSLWLEGDLGSGKTTFTKELLYTLGLDRTVPVASPTYTYLLEYETDNGLCAHMDLYRFTEGVAFEEDEMLGHADYSGFILEWPGNVLLPDSMQATHKLHLSYINPDLRKYSFYESSS